MTLPRLHRLATKLARAFCLSSAWSLLICITSNLILFSCSGSIALIALRASSSAVSAPLSLLVKYRGSLGIFLGDRLTVGRHDHHSIRSRFRALVPVLRPSVAGTRACRLATSADRLAAATPLPPPALFRRPAPVGMPLLSVIAGPRRLGNRQTGDGSEMASQGLSDLLAVAITLSRTPQRRAPKSGP